MHRRHFGKSLLTAALAPAAAKSAPRQNSHMHVGADYHSVAGPEITSPQNLDYTQRYGVKHLTAQLRKGPWDLDDLRRMRDNCDKAGGIFEAIRMDPTYITLRPGPDRDRELDTILANIEKASQVGVKLITYHWTVIPIRRNHDAPGRGRVTYAGFKLEPDWRDLPSTKAGKVSSAEYWERIEHFLKTVIPVAQQHDVRFACHPYDPPGLPFGYQGAENWDSPGIFDAFKRYEALVDSPYNGFQLCLGTTAEGLKHPKTEVLPIVHYLGERGKIYQVHMRNIRGGYGDFQEVYPDEGEMDFFQIMRVLRDVQFSGSILPDHMPKHPDDTKSLQSFAFGFGYIKALIQAVNSEVAA